MKRPPDLSLVIEVSRRRRDDALQALARAQRDRQMAELQLQQLSDYSFETQTRWTERATQGVNANLLVHQQHFLGKIDYAVEFQRGVIQRLELHLSHCREQLLLAERELASREQYAQRLQGQWQHHENREEQKRNDEMAMQLHRRRSSPLSWRHSA